MAVESVAISLYGLPLETLQQIAGYLAGSHRPSLSSFALTSKACHGAAAMFIFSHIRLNIRNRDELRRDIDALTETLACTDSARHVQSLSLVGFLDHTKPRNEKGAFDDIDYLDWWKVTQNCEPLIDHVIPIKEPTPVGRYVVYDECIIEKNSDEDRAWAPVMTFIKALPSLVKLVYECPNQFPPSLLDSLHEYHPQCKLHHLTFRLRTLLWDTPHSNEIALATSPCLQKVKIFCTWRDSDGDDDFNQEAIMELVAGLAPNLKQVTMVKFTPNLSPKYIRPRGRWQGLPGFIPKKIGSLTSLSVIGKLNLRSPELIDVWAKYTDFSLLQHLSLGGAGNGGLSSELMSYISQNYSFPRLRTLCLVLTRDDGQEEKPHYGDNVIAFFISLKPLEELSISGPLEPKIIDTILCRHGRTLTKLVLHPVEAIPYGDTVRREMPLIFTKDYILKIQTECLKLEELVIPVKRMKSNKAEVEVYKSFTKMERLRSLFLILDCSDWRPYRDMTYDPSLEPEFDEFDLQTWSNYVKNGHLRTALMNCAVDETLARSIWGLISQNKTGRQLESLRLWTTGAGTFGGRQNQGMFDFAENMSRSWLLKRLPRDDKDVITVMEIGQFAREARDQEYRESRKRRLRFLKMRDYEASLTPEQREAEIAKYGELQPPPDSDSDSDYGLDEDRAKIFSRIWPRTEGSKNWREEWSSLPLEV